MLVTDGQGRVLSLNAEMREQFGLPAHPGAQRHLDDWLPLASRIFVQTHVWPLLLRQGRVNEIHLKLKGADGEARPVTVPNILIDVLTLPSYPGAYEVSFVIFWKVLISLNFLISVGKKRPPSGASPLKKIFLKSKFKDLFLVLI